MRAYISIILTLLIFLGFGYPNGAHSACSDFHGNETACNNLEDDDNCVYLELGGQRTAAIVVTQTLVLVMQGLLGKYLMMP